MTSETAPSEPGQAEPTGRKNPVTRPGHLPLTELLFERQGAASPFGEDTEFPLPVEDLPYVHPWVSDE
jgi:succinate dehydrogenase / fumarate reductase iron-sulfur subunit